MIAAACFGLAFGMPFMVWGIILIVDRDRTWQRKLQRAQPGERLNRNSAWDRRQIIYGILLAMFGAAVFIVLALLNAFAQGISPPPPF